MPIYDHSDILSESDTHIDSSGSHRKPPEVAVAMDTESEKEPEALTFIGCVRHNLREPLSEFLGTLVLIVLGEGVEAQVRLFESKTGGWTSIVFGWAFAVMCGIYVSGGVSGGHINPAVTLCFAMFRDFPWRKVPIYIFAQIFGAFIGAAIVFGNYRKGFTKFAGEGKYTVTGPNQTAEVFATYPNDIMTTEGSFFEEMLGTCILLIVILAQTDHHNMYAGNMLPLAVGLCVAAIGFGLGYQTGYAVNPARDLGPRIFSAIAGWGPEVFTASNSFTWVPVIAPFVGGALGGLIYELFIDSESNRSRITHKRH
ncbi:hypothetical protein INT43_003084 [Umbelopsis isabellina]|uniref:Aquaporin n=1 Tax=Mortierella isabellina TaxID=91625 RepID=A0A8H7PPF6_MORIS|nr:hypothetical protein INT43_003084 [Umbelopsis isabellina]